LQRVFGISAHEALNERPVWEIDNLLAHHAREKRR
jgi:hypothetical protein